MRDTSAGRERYDIFDGLICKDRRSVNFSRDSSDKSQLA